MTGYNFDAALGLPKEFHRKKPQAVYRHWRLREDQFLFLQEMFLSSVTRPWRYTCGTSSTGFLRGYSQSLSSR